MIKYIHNYLICSVKNIAIAVCDLLTIRYINTLPYKIWESLFFNETIEGVR